MKINWSIKKVKLSDLKEDPENPRIITEDGLNDLNESIKKFGLADPIAANLDFMILGGHARKISLLAQGITEADVYFPDRLLKPKEVRELNIRLNKNKGGSFDLNILSNEYDVDKLLSWGFTEKELNIVSNTKNREKEIDENIDTEYQCPHCNYKW